MRKIILILIITLTFLGTGFTKEKILSFESHVDIRKSGEFIVTEKIEVNVEGNIIKRGIYRDFPTKYKTKEGLDYIVTFDVLEVKKNGQKEPYFIKSIPNGKRVYIGNKDVFLKPGIYLYTLVYKTKNQMGFFKDFDEIYWNVTGNDWEFEIDNVKFYATIEGHPIDNIIAYGAYTGSQGSKAKNFKTYKDDYGNVVFTATNLKPKEGLTVYIDFPKGIIHEPTQKEKNMQKIQSNLTLFISFGGVVLLLITNTLIWFFVGKDPAKGVIVPLFEPPHNISAGAMRYLNKMGYDNKVTSSAIISMAAKGTLNITEHDKTFVLSRIQTADIGELSTAEKAFFDKLFHRRDEIDLNDVNDAEIFREALKKYKKALKSEFEKTYFNSNKQYLLPGVLISLASLIGAVYFASDRYTAIFMTAWLTIWTFGVSILMVKILGNLKSALKDKTVSSYLSAIFIILFSIPFIAGEIFGLTVLIQTTSIYFIIALLLHVIIQIIFYHLMKAPTRLGRTILDKIEGFKEFLTRVEKDRLKLMYSKDELPKVFEKFLPYAMALDVEDKWASAVETALKELKSSYNYKNISWYNGAMATGGLVGFAEGLSSAAVGATAAAASPPGSSSGSGFGGSSGGGGGGGGGGGW